MARNREEDTCLDQMRQVFEAMGFLTYHTRDSRGSSPGFPDLWVLGFGSLTVLELKTERNDLTADQRRWIEELERAGINVRVYRTTEWRSRNIVRELQAIKLAYIRQTRRIR